ncbi:MAG: rod shape-determining protein MreC [Trueperaceae bacterium]
MSNLLRAWYIFLALGFLTFLLTSFLGRVSFTLSSAVAMPTQLFFTVASNIRNTAIQAAERSQLLVENKALENRVGVLETKNRELQIELERLQQLLQVRDLQSPGAFLTAPVTDIGSSSIQNQLTIGRGSNHGVKVNAPVTVPKGLVGIVTAVNPRSAVVRAITDLDSKVGITVRGRGGQGIAVGEPGGNVRVINFIEDDSIEVDDLVETSSRGGLFPRGILIGKVTEVSKRNPNDLRIAFVVEPAVEVTTLSEVTLIEPQ